MNMKAAELREVIKKLVPMLTGKGLKVTMRGSRAYVETDARTKKPRRVNIPNIPDDASVDFIEAIQGFIDHEVAHVLITDWNIYGGGLTASNLTDPKVRRLMDAHNITEDTMIEKEIVKIFPGSKKNISRLRQHFIENVTKKALAGATCDKERFSYLLVPAVRALAGHQEFQDFMDEEGHWEQSGIKHVVDSLSENDRELLRTATSTTDTLASARRLVEIMYPEPKNEDENSDGESEESSNNSQDLPDKEAGEGDGTGDRDHSEEDQSDDTPSESSPEPAEESDESEDASEPDDSESSGESDRAESGAGDEEGEQDNSDEESEETKSSLSDGSSETVKDSGESPEKADYEGEDSDLENSSECHGTNRDTDDEDAPESESEALGEENDNTSGDDLESEDGSEEESEASGEDVCASEKDALIDEDDSTPSDEESSDQENQSEGGGVGSASGRDRFSLEDENVFEGRDLSSEMAEIISVLAEECVSESEWSTYSTEWDKVEPAPVGKSLPLSAVSEMDERVRGMIGRMQKDIERSMASRSHVVNTPGHRKGKLHSPSLYRVLQGDPRVFTQRQEHVSKDTAVTLLVDNSGSMTGDRIVSAMLASYALSLTLERVGISHEIIGFTTGDYADLKKVEKAANQDNEKVQFDRYWPIVMPVYKSFQERLGTEVKSRIAYAMHDQRGLLGNIDGESLEIAARRIAPRPEKRKVIIVLSDGQPAGGWKSGGHLKHVVDTLNKSGIETIGIGIQSKAVKEYYEKSVVLEKLDDLPGQVMSEIKSILL